MVPKRPAAPTSVIVVQTKRPKGHAPLPIPIPDTPAPKAGDAEILPAKNLKAASKKRARDAEEAAQSGHENTEAGKSDSDEVVDSDRQPTAKKVKLAKKKDPRATALKGNKQNSPPCEYCQRNGYQCWRQGGPAPRGSCYECALGKHRCPSTQQFATELKEEKELEMLEKRKKAKLELLEFVEGRLGEEKNTAKGMVNAVVRPLSGQPTKPGRQTRPAANSHKATKPRAAPATVPSSSEDESVPPQEKTVTFKGTQCPEHSHLIIY
jgi:hypothetical protein